MKFFGIEVSIKVLSDQSVYLIQGFLRIPLLSEGLSKVKKKRAHTPEEQF